ncbi:trace amine-associated receptor 3-like [Montipora capricornis]|uniref:trace amine-associated receptor 3-like n=1 Tax=Montipora capricornis TaxID=246305 RepID=UPI0035F1C518
MAAVRGIVDYWNMTSDEALVQVWLNVDKAETIFTTVAVLATITSPITTFGNFLIVLSVWMGPLRKLRSSPSNFIIFSMAVADLPFFETFINLSVSHILLLSIDRFFAVVTPLQYRAKVTSKRVCIVSFTCWIYFSLFGFVFSLLRKHYALMGTLYNVQIFCILICIVVINVLTLYRFRKYSHSTEVLDDQHAGVSRQMILQRERTVSKAIAIVISAFLLCFIPWFIVQMIMHICLTWNFLLLMLAHFIAAAVMYANSAINPFLYAWRLPKSMPPKKPVLGTNSRHSKRLHPSEPPEVAPTTPSVASSATPQANNDSGVMQANVEALATTISVAVTEAVNAALANRRSSRVNPSSFHVNCASK